MSIIFSYAPGVTAGPTANVSIVANPVGLATAANQGTEIAALAAILAKIIAAPATAANQATEITTLAAILAGQAGAATAANQVSEIASLAAILAKLIAAPATEAKQDAEITALAAILAKLIAAPATEAKQDAQIVIEQDILDGQFTSAFGGISVFKDITADDSVFKAAQISVFKDQDGEPVFTELVTFKPVFKTATGESVFKDDVELSVFKDDGGKGAFTDAGNASVFKGATSQSVFKSGVGDDSVFKIAGTNTPILEGAFITSAATTCKTFTDTNTIDLAGQMTDWMQANPGLPIISINTFIAGLAGADFYGIITHN